MNPYEPPQTEQTYNGLLRQTVLEGVLLVAVAFIWSDLGDKVHWSLHGVWMATYITWGLNIAERFNE